MSKHEIFFGSGVIIATVPRLSPEPAIYEVLSGPGVQAEVKRRASLRKIVYSPGTVIKSPYCVKHTFVWGPSLGGWAEMFILKYIASFCLAKNAVTSDTPSKAV